MTVEDSDRIISRYSQLARAALGGEAISDCDPGTSEDGCFGAAAYANRSEAPEAAYEASLGCGNPLTVADLRPGETVLDLGSGGGLDVLLSARRVAPDGIAYGVDASSDMLTLARRNAAKAQITNVRFLEGHIEELPLPDNHVDVVISNCVINLSGDKPRVLAEAFRVLKPGGRLGVSDVIADAAADPARLARAEQQVGCVAGALTQAEYQRSLVAAGFSDVTITSTYQAADSLHSAIIEATKQPMVPPGKRVLPAASVPAEHSGPAATVTVVAADERVLRGSSFGGAAAAYSEHRPDYAQDAVRWALAPAPGLRVLDLGAGTGKLTAMLVALGADVTAVEPDPAMLAELHRLLPEVRGMAGTAEAIPLPDASVDAVVAGQALHWFDMAVAGPEIARVLVPGGILAGLWNVDDDRVDWVAKLEGVSAGSASLTLASWNAHAADIRLASMDLPGLFSPPDRAEFPHGLRRTAEPLLATIATHSSLLIMDDEARTALLGRIGDYLARLPETSAGEFILPMLTGVLRARRE